MENILKSLVSGFTLILIGKLLKFRLKINKIKIQCYNQIISTKNQIQLETEISTYRIQT